MAVKLEEVPPLAISRTPSKLVMGGVACTEYTPLLAMTKPEPVARFRVVPEVPLKSTISESTELAGPATPRDVDQAVSAEPTLTKSLPTPESFRIPMEPMGACKPEPEVGSTRRS
jgi:hypothetical protein